MKPTTRGSLQDAAVQGGLASLRDRIADRVDRSDRLSVDEIEAINRRERARIDAGLIPDPYASLRPKLTLVPNAVPVSTTVDAPPTGNRTLHVPTRHSGVPYENHSPGMRMRRGPPVVGTINTREQSVHACIKGLGLERHVSVAFVWGSDSFVRLTVRDKVMEVEHDAVPVVLKTLQTFELFKPQTGGDAWLQIPRGGLLARDHKRQAKVSGRAPPAAKPTVKAKASTKAKSTKRGVAKRPVKQVKAAKSRSARATPQLKPRKLRPSSKRKSK